MSLELFVITFSAVAALPGLYRIALTILFYLGQRRDFYFVEQDPLIWYAQGCSVLYMYLMTIYLIAITVNQGASSLICISVILFFLQFVVLVVVLPWTSRFPPRWVRELEAVRAPEDLTVIREEGRNHLQDHATLFKQIISTRDGWETWLLTIHQAIPRSQVSLLIKQGERALLERDFQGTHQIADELTRARPAHSPGYHLRARILLEEGQLSEALALFDRCVAMEPHNVEFYYGRAHTLLMAGQMDAAKADIEAVAALSPDNVRQLVLRDIAARRQQQLDERHADGL